LILLKEVSTDNEGAFLMGRQAEFWSESKNNSKIDGQPKAKSRFASKRPNGTINTHPQERMRAANQQEE
jgi:small acid-soluble spore protein K (minor)